MRRILLTLVVLLSLAVPARAQIGLPVTSFSPGQTISSEVFTTAFTLLDSRALNRTGGTMTGTLLFSPDNAVDVGQSSSNRPRDLFVARNFTLGGTATLNAAIVTTTLTVNGNLTCTGCLGAASLATNAVTEAKIAANAVTSAKIAAGAVTNSHVTGVTVFPRKASTETVTGLWTFNNPPLLSDNPARLRFFDTGSSPGTRALELTADTNHLILRFFDDTFTTPFTAFQVSRTGNTTIFGDLSVDGKMLATAANITLSLPTTLASSRLTITNQGLTQTGSGFASSFAGTVDFGAAVTMQGTLAIASTFSAPLVNAEFLTVSALQRRTGAITATPATTQHDWNPPGLATANVIRATGAAARTITGIVDQPFGTNYLLVNQSDFSLTLSGENAGSVAGNRFAGSVTIAPHRMVMIYRDASTSRWVAGG